MIFLDEPSAGVNIRRIMRIFALQKQSNSATEFAVTNNKCYDYSKRTIRQRPVKQAVEREDKDYYGHTSMR